MAQSEIPEIPDDIKRAARKAVYDTDGRGMVGRERNYLELRVRRAILAERKRCADQIAAYRQCVEDNEDLDVLERVIRHNTEEP